MAFASDAMLGHFLRPLRGRCGARLQMHPRHAVIFLMHFDDVDVGGEIGRRDLESDFGAADEQLHRHPTRDENG